MKLRPEALRDLVTLSVAADRLGVSVRQLRGRIASGQLAAAKPAGTRAYLVRMVDVRAALAPRARARTERPRQRVDRQRVEAAIAGATEVDASHDTEVRLSVGNAIRGAWEHARAQALPRKEGVRVFTVLWALWLAVVPGDGDSAGLGYLYDAAKKSLNRYTRAGIRDGENDLWSVLAAAPVYEFSSDNEQEDAILDRVEKLVVEGIKAPDLAPRLASMLALAPLSGRDDVVAVRRVLDAGVPKEKLGLARLLVRVMREVGITKARRPRPFGGLLRKGM